MSYDFHRQWLERKFGELQHRMLLALDQLEEEHVNWRPNEQSHSIATLIRHIEGNILERVVRGIGHEPIVRDREGELSHRIMSKAELERIVRERLQLVIDTVGTISDDALTATQTVRSKERTNLDMLHQCAAHYSEHVGQILYLAKMQLGESYRSTSI